MTLEGGGCFFIKHFQADAEELPAGLPQKHISCIGRELD